MSKNREFDKRKKFMMELLGDPVYQPMRFRELAGLLRLSKEDKKDLYRVLDELVAEGKANLDSKGRYFKVTGRKKGKDKPSRNDHGRSKRDDRRSGRRYEEENPGIRLENELVCCKDEKNSYGQFMHFENITYVPFDLDAVVPQQMTETERARLNAYHKKVYTVVSPYLEGDELEWLKEATREI